jgi:trigger factor|tara:strand:+ start:17603 stop:18922 length:1320 start_codon:yes stop_codon:yes gene_type:complete
LKYKIKKESEFEKNLEIKVELEDLEDHRDEAIKKIGKQIKVDGFRTGKIPANIVIREVGEDYINEEAIELFLPQTLFSILNDEEISPATRPAIKEIKKEKNHFEVNVLITLWPKLSKLPKLSQTVEVDSITPTDEEIADQIERIKSQFADVSKVERPLNSGDYAMMNLSATKNGVEVKDFTYNDYLYEVGTGALTPSLDSKLEGVAPGAIIKFNDTIPQLSEENVEITVLVKEVREKILPELTDEWVADTTEFDNVDSLKKELVINIENVKKQQIASQYQGELTNKLIEEVDMKLPEQLVITEMDSILQNFLNELKQSNIQLEDYFKITGLTEETLRDDLNKQASRNLTMVLILDKVIEDLDMKLDEKDVALVDEHMSTHKDEEEDSDQTSHRMNLEAESLRNKAMLHILQQGISVDRDGEKVNLQDVYNRDTDLGEEE